MTADEAKDAAQVVTVKAGVIVKIDGIPFELKFDTDLIGNPENIRMAIPGRDRVE
jgi:hypothetical protein